MRREDLSWALCHGEDGRKSYLKAYYQVCFVSHVPVGFEYKTEPKGAYLAEAEFC